ncbi:MAG: hypothetical protein FWC58_06675 [Desulfobulbus sp.]|nr:hypothetical protein [Desulfobulbus sp.]
MTHTPHNPVVDAIVRTVADEARAVEKPYRMSEEAFHQFDLACQSLGALATLFAAHDQRQLGLLLAEEVGSLLSLVHDALVTAHAELTNREVVA